MPLLFWNDMLGMVTSFRQPAHMTKSTKQNTEGDQENHLLLQDFDEVSEIFQKKENNRKFGARCHHESKFYVMTDLSQLHRILAS